MRARIMTPVLGCSLQCRNRAFQCVRTPEIWARQPVHIHYSCVLSVQVPHFFKGHGRAGRGLKNSRSLEHKNAKEGAGERSGLVLFKRNLSAQSGGAGLSKKLHSLHIPIFRGHLYRPSKFCGRRGAAHRPSQTAARPCRKIPQNAAARAYAWGLGMGSFRGPFLGDSSI